ncbi:MAG: hypothetical protein ACYCYI_01585 [Saccharofermentanales bacterium]
MKEKYSYIKSEKARELLSRIKEMDATKSGVDSHVFLIGEYAVLTTSRIKLRNVTTRDDDLSYFDELIETLMSLRDQGVAVVPVLGYCFDPDSENGSGYIFQQRAKGEELYDDAIMNTKYILSRTNYISKVSQIHFNKFISDIIILFDNDILIDFNAKSNFFYDDTAGFQFIDLDSHTDFKYGLADHRPDSKELTAHYGFAPCHVAVGTKVLAHLALDENAISTLNDKELQQLVRDNKTIFEKCKTAMLKNGISEEQLENSLKVLKIFGC